MTDKGHCKHGEFILTEGCPQCIAERQKLRQDAIRLRQELGWSIRTIAGHLETAPSNIHFWVSNNGEHKVSNKSTPLAPNNIYCMDCLEGLRGLPHNSVDLVFADPPYNIGVPVQVPVIRETYASELDECQAVIEFNRCRIKTGQQFYNEGQALKEIEAAKAKQRQATSTGGVIPQLVADLPQAEGRTRDIIAQSIGLGSGRQWDKLEYVAAG